MSPHYHHPHVIVIIASFIFIIARLLPVILFVYPFLDFHTLEPAYQGLSPMANLVKPARSYRKDVFDLHLGKPDYEMKYFRRTLYSVSVSSVGLCHVSCTLYVIY